MKSETLTKADQSRLERMWF